jgi:hypothetical protein
MKPCLDDRTSSSTFELTQTQEEKDPIKDRTFSCVSIIYKTKLG